MKNDIQNREDVFNLVSSFYTKVRKNSEIGHFFNETVTDWPKHLEKLTDFWETNLFMVAKFRGNPVKAHKQVDQKFRHSIEPRHSGEWLNMWFATIDELFEGERAHIAKNRARNMAGNIFMNIYHSRGKQVVFRPIITPAGKGGGNYWRYVLQHPCGAILGEPT